MGLKVGNANQDADLCGHKEGWSKQYYAPIIIQFYVLDEELATTARGMRVQNIRAVALMPIHGHFSGEAGFLARRLRRVDKSGCFIMLSVPFTGLLLIGFESLAKRRPVNGPDQSQRCRLSADPA